MEIGIIGLGDMGKLYAKTFVRAGCIVNGCDLPEKRSKLEEELQGTGIFILDDGVAVSRKSDLIIYSVEAENIERAVRQYGSSTKTGAIVAGQTSVKTPEIAAFERYLPKDVNIVSCHSLHGPTVNPVGQTLVVIRHRASDESYKQALEVFEKLGSNIIEMPNYQEHDRITADTQAVTHIGFESMGTAWKNTGFYPWENPSYVGGIDNVKILMMLRILGGKSHVYSGLAILNPFAKEQIRQYAQSVSELFKMMIQEDEEKFRKRVREAGEFVFGDNDMPILLDDKVLGEFSLGTIPSDKRKPNSHLSLLAMVDAWHQLKVNPYKNLVCQTPVFKLRLGIDEYLFKNQELLEESLKTALFDKGIRRDDLEFCTAVREWASIVEHGDIEGYKQKFAATREFFKEYNFSVGLSLDGPEELNDKTRIYKNSKDGDKGTFQDILNSIRILKRRGIDANVIVTLNQQNIKDVGGIYQFLKNHRLNARFNPIVRAGRAIKNYGELSISPEEFEEAKLNLFDTWFSDTEPIHLYCFEEMLKNILSKNYLCECTFSNSCQKGFISVTPQGDVYPCGEFHGIEEFRYGNINKNSLEEIFSHPLRKKLLERGKNIEECAINCEYQELCHGGCMSNAYGSTGNIMDRDPYCLAYKSLFRHINHKIKYSN